ncbi:TPA: hypothetical protein ACH3X3_005071 [Trebouxia sp. C0006]
MQLSLQNLQIDDQLSESRFPAVLSPAEIAEEASEYHPLLSLAVISQPGLAREDLLPSHFLPGLQDPADLTE